ncbi:MAG: hypothetical protein D3M94_22210 [Rhodocyclales bacterium GT-UBC]|nr:MAG: hypothetical protein D3M94_22210 [Rhodocyclales bacterium GT-UBC]
MRGLRYQPTWQRAAVMAAVGVVCGLFHSQFVRMLSVEWSYFGFVYRNQQMSGVLVAYCCALAPSLWLETGALRPSTVVTEILYLIVYIPSVFCVSLMSPSTAEAIPLLGSMLAGMAILSGPFRLARSRRPKRRSALRLPSMAVFMSLVWSATGVLVLAVVVSYWDRLSWPSFDTMYQIRLAARSVQDASPIGRYFTHWLARLLLPLLIAVALWRRTYWQLVLVAAAYAVLLAATAHKVYVVGPATVVGLHLLVRFVPKRIGVGLAVGSAAVLAVVAVVGWSMTTELVFVRTMGWSGLATYLYSDFVATHPYTWWSHVTGVGLVISNPYDTAIPLLIGGEYFRNPDLTSNAHFWAMDGLMAAGHAGVVVISMVCALLFRLVDELAESVVPTVAVPWLGSYATSLGDAGLFSALLTGGLAFALVVLWWFPRSLRVEGVEAASGRN